MPYDLIGFSEAAPGTGTVNIAPGGNGWYYSTGDDMFIKAAKKYCLGILYAAESTPGRAMLDQPSKKVAYEFLKAMDLNDADPVGGFTDMRARPIPLVPDEKVNAQSVNATDEDTIIGLMMGSGKIRQATIDGVNPTDRIRGYADQTLTANSWTKVTMTWDYDLPEGRYNIVGMKYGVYKASGFMAGLARIFPNVEDMTCRPGVPITQLAGDKVTFDAVSMHPWEDWPSWSDVYLLHNRMPDFEVLSPAASTDHAVELTLQKVG